MHGSDDPRRVGNIRIDGVLGEGGMGTVYVGFDETLERKVALKSIRAERRLGERARRRFLREARTLGQLEHPAICRIHGYVEQDGVDYLVLEHVPGVTLWRHIQGGRLEERHRLDIALQIADALAAAHERGIVHRDLKPDNVMITPEGAVKVLDFGLARHEDAPLADGAPGASPVGVDETTDEGTGAGTDRFGSGATPLASWVTEAGHIAGTPASMSPEQARGAAVTTASDMYSYGLLLQALWSGRGPYPDDLRGVALLRRAARGETEPIRGAPRDVAALIERCKAVAPAARATAVEVLGRLRWRRDRPARLARRGVAVALLLVAVGAGVKYTVDLERERALAEDARTVADQRRGQAEELLRFMQDDLRDKLRAVGRLDVLEDVHRSAARYYAAVPEAELTLAELTMRAQGLYQIGEVRYEQGDLPAAMEAFAASLALGQRLVERAPDDVQAWKRVAYAHFWIGDGSFQAQDHAASLAAFEAARDAARQLVALEPDEPEWRLELAAEESNIARVLQAQGDLVAACAMLEQRLATVTEIAALDRTRVEWQRELADSHVILGAALEESGDLAGARRHYEQDEVLLTGLVGRHPADARLLDRLATSHTYMGAILEALGDREAAAEHAEAAREITAVLAAGDETSAAFRAGLAVSLRNLGSLRGDEGDLDGAEELFTTSLSLVEELARQDPSRPVWQQYRAQAHGELGRVAERRGQLDQALDHARRALELLASSPRRASDATGDAITDAAVDAAGDATAGDEGLARMLAVAELLRGRVLADLGRADEAREAWGLALAAIRPHARGSRNAMLLSPCAQALLWLGRGAEAAPLLAELDSQRFREVLLTEARAQLRVGDD